jgi:hypothetical protein
MPMFEKLLLKI